MEKMKSKELFEWREDLLPSEWDAILSSMQGHPLQSAQWGQSRYLSDGISDRRWVAYKNGYPVYLIRFEERKIFGLLKVAWSPKGPTIADPVTEKLVEKDFFKRLKKEKYFLCVTNPWKKAASTQNKKSYHQTIWIDLTVGKEKLWNNLSKQVRYDIRRAKKLNLSIQKSKDSTDIYRFYELCQSISSNKGFTLSASNKLMSQLLTNVSDEKYVESYLFSAHSEEKFCGAAFIIRFGESIHYMWGAVDRAFSKLNIGEAIQWEVIEWALEQQCTLYDLEGIDPKSNPGTYLFKKKLGGDVTVLAGEQIYFLNKFARFTETFFNPYRLLRFFHTKVKPNRNR